MTQVIYVYTRKLAIGDGVLVDVSKLASELGIVMPVAVSAGVWAECVRVPEAVSGWQDETGRLWDLLNIFRLEAKTASSNQVDFKALFQNSENAKPEAVLLKGHCGPGDDGEPVITIMLPGED